MPLLLAAMLLAGGCVEDEEFFDSEELADEDVDGQSFRDADECQVCEDDHRACEADRDDVSETRSNAPPDDNQHIPRPWEMGTACDANYEQCILACVDGML